MAKITVVAVRDRALDSFGRPFYVNTPAQAIRSFMDEMNRAEPDNAMARHPEDYELYALATWDEETGEFVNAKKQLALGTTMLITKGS